METVETLNYRLERNYGLFDTTNLPLYRVVFSEDQFEKRELWYTDEGLQLLSPVVKEVPKYRQWLHHKWLLEKLIVVPDLHDSDVMGKFSYEPLWVFEDKHGNPLPPKWEVIFLVISTVHANMAKTMGAKYKDPLENESKEEKSARVDRLVAELFGNETDTGDALKYKEGIVVPKGME